MAPLSYEGGSPAGLRVGVRCQRGFAVTPVGAHLTMLAKTFLKIYVFRAFPQTFVRSGVFIEFHFSPVEPDQIPARALAMVKFKYPQQAPSQA